MNNIATRIREAREARGWTQDELAARIGSTGMTVSHWETGRRTPHPRWLVKLADALGCPTDWLLGRAD
jgi:transcriptional regulator with XRE-family HTH domain